MARPPCRLVVRKAPRRVALYPVLPCVLAESASHLGRLRLLLELVDLVCLSDRLNVHAVLEPLHHGFEVLEALLQNLEARPVLVLLGIGSGARSRLTRAESNNQALEHPRWTPCPLNC